MSRNLIESVVATITSAALWYFGDSLTPIPWLVWLAPIPILVLAARATWRTTAICAFLAYLLGSIGLLRYYAFDIRAPIPAVVALAIAAPLLITGVVLLYRGLLVRRRPVLAGLGFASAWTTVEYLVALVGPTGSNWSLANSQADMPPVLQLASATGLWGITFLTTLIPAAIATLFAPGIPPISRIRVGTTGAALLAVALVYGFIQLSMPTGPTVRVTVLAVRAAADEPHLGTPEGDALLAADLAAIRAIPPGSTRIVVLPEKDFIADDTTLPAVNSQFTAAAKTGKFDIVVGLGVWTPGLRYNTALAFPADGGSPVVYHKEFPVPGVEARITPGHADAFLADTADPIGVAICADLGQPALGRRYAEQGARLMVVPALDFTVDAWSQSRVQLMRAVENGYSMARPARLGYLLLADPHGRVLAETLADTSAPVASRTADSHGRIPAQALADTSTPVASRTADPHGRVPAQMLADTSAPVASRTADSHGRVPAQALADTSAPVVSRTADSHRRVPAQTLANTSAPVASRTADLPLRTGTTLYTRWGDWFGYLCLVGSVLAVVSLRRRGEPSVDIYTRA